MTNFKLTLAYDGTDYHGWQRQKSDVTIQQSLEDALKTMTGERIPVNGSGRTDAGVHALAQVANFHSETKITTEAMAKGLNSLTGEDIVVKRCEIVDEGFHARHDVSAKTYRYRILNRPLPDPMERRFSWHIRKPLDIGLMRAAANLLVGKHDFKAFEGAGSPRPHSVRTLFRMDIARRSNDILTIEIEGDGFLRFMVRNIVGTLVDVGLEKISAEEVAGILHSKDRSRAGITAPAQGLFLVSVAYA